MSVEMLNEYAKRLGIQDLEVLKKSTELLRLINLKQSSWNETLKIVMSINCAADECGTDFDHESAMKRCNLKKKEYNKQKELFEKLLNLSRGLSLSEICAQFELNDTMKNTAAQLLNEYKKRQTLLSDINSQQALSSMAIYQSCKLKKFKGLTSIKTKLIQLSKLNPNSWKQLETEWNSWIEKSSPLSEQTKRSIHLPETEEKDFMKTNNQYISGGMAHERELHSYEEWREDMLKRAGSLLKRKE